MLCVCVGDVMDVVFSFVASSVPLVTTICSMDSCYAYGQIVHPSRKRCSTNYIFLDF